MRPPQPDSPSYQAATSIYARRESHCFCRQLLFDQAYKVPLDYNFEIYTYGPYFSEVMEDMELAKCQNVISMKVESYSGYVGYSINNCQPLGVDFFADLQAKIPSAT